MTTSHQNEIMVVSGASTGIGAATARELATRGFHVLAGVRRQRDADAIRAAGIEPVILDVTDPEHIQAIVERIAGDPQHRALRALVNNAGVSVNAPVETFPLDEWRRLYEVNLFGHIAITQALLPFLLRSHGRIVNISSVGGRIAMATYGPYAGTKFALEAISDSLRRELAPHGVQVVVVEPGAVITAMGDRGIATTTDLAAAMGPDQQQRYAGLVTTIVAQTSAAMKTGTPAAKAGTIVANAATTRRPRTRYTIGREAALLPIMRILPDRLLDRLLEVNLRRHLPTAAPVNRRKVPEKTPLRSRPEDQPVAEAV